MFAVYGKRSIFTANRCGDFKMQTDRAGAARRGWILCFNKRTGSRMLKEAMMLVLETNGSLLYLYSSGAEAEAHLEAIDIENGEYEVCDDVRSLNDLRRAHGA
jgi:hypothetical protein